MERLYTGAISINTTWLVSQVKSSDHSHLTPHPSPLTLTPYPHPSPLLARALWEGKCNDGGSGKHYHSVYGALCDLGTDCDDCGVRQSPPPSPPVTPPRPPIWPPITNPYTPLCTNDCPSWASDGYCYDGGAGSEDDYCDYGDDCEDCGERPYPLYRAFYERTPVYRSDYKPMSCNEDQQRLEITSAEECWKAAAWIAQNLGGTLALPSYNGRPFDPNIAPVDDGLSSSTTYPRGCYAHTSGDKSSSSTVTVLKFNHNMDNTGTRNSCMYGNGWTAVVSSLAVTPVRASPTLRPSNCPLPTAPPLHACGALFVRVDACMCVYVYVCVCMRVHMCARALRACGAFALTHAHGLSHTRSSDEQPLCSHLSPHPSPPQSCICGLPLPSPSVPPPAPPAAPPPLPWSPPDPPSPPRAYDIVPHRSPEGDAESCEDIGRQTITSIEECHAAAQDLDPALCATPLPHPLAVAPRPRPSPPPLLHRRPLSRL